MPRQRGAPPSVLACPMKETVHPKGLFIGERHKYAHSGLPEAWLSAPILV